MHMDYNWLHYPLLNNIITLAHVHYIALLFQVTGYGFLLAAEAAYRHSKLQRFATGLMLMHWWFIGHWSIWHSVGFFHYVLYSLSLSLSSLVLTHRECEKNQYLKKTTKYLLLHNSDTV